MAGEKIVGQVAKEVAEKLVPGATAAAEEAIVAGARRMLPETAQRMLGIEATTAVESRIGLTAEDALRANTMAGDNLRAEFMAPMRTGIKDGLGVIEGFDTAKLSDTARGHLARLTPQERANLIGPMKGSTPEDLSELIEMVGPKLSTRNDFLPVAKISETLANGVKVGEIGNNANAALDWRQSVVTGLTSPDRFLAREWISSNMPKAMQQPPLTAILPNEAGMATSFGEGRFAVGKIGQPLQTEHLETCAAIACVDRQAGRQILLHAGDWNTAEDIASVFKQQGFDLGKSELSIMIGPRASTTLENILPALKDANGAIRPVRVIPSPKDMYPAAVSSYNGEFYVPNTLYLGK